MYQAKAGMKLDELDTPAVIIDLDLMEANINRLMQKLVGKVAVRPHFKTIKSPELARKLIEAGAVGGCVAKISEAEVMAAGGIEDLLITTEIIGQPKLARLVTLLKEYPNLKLKGVVDSLSGATALNQALAANNLQLELYLDVNVGQNRTGLNPGEVLEFAQKLRELPQLHLIGLHGYEGHLQHVPEQGEREKLCREAMQRLVRVAEELRKAGFDIQVVSTGGTGTAEICAAYPGVTEVQPGSFIFMDVAYRTALGPVYSNSLTILSTVLSRPVSNRAVIDAGLKSLSTDSGMAEVKKLEGVKYRPGGDEHGILEWADTNQAITLEVGDRVEMIPSHIDTTINLHDFYYGYRSGQIETIWPISARGKVQ